MNAITVAITIIILYAGYKINWKKVWYNHEEFFKVIFVVVLVASVITGIIWAGEKDVEKKCLEWGEERNLEVKYKFSSEADKSCLVIINGGKVRKTTYEEMKALEPMEEDGL